MAFREAFLDLDRSRPALGEQLASSLREAVDTGRLAPGTRLPASRDLAAELGVSRGLVVGVYELLLAEGRLTARPGSGTYVAGALGTAQPYRPVEPPRVPPAPRPGLPDLSRFPRLEWRRAFERVLRTVTDPELDYGDPAGALRLRTELAGYLGRVRAARVAPRDIVVTTGAAQAFALLAAVLRPTGGTGNGRAAGGTGDGRQSAIGVEDPGSPPIRAHLSGHGLRCVPVPVDAEGVDVAALERTGLRAVTVTPAHQYPTGVALTAGRRSRLVAWARRVGGLIVEDDYDAEFRYDREPVACIQGMAPDVVALVGSVSKALAPALRLGWVVTPPGLRAAVVAEKAAADNCGPVLEQLTFAEFLATGGYDRHLRVLRRVYRRRRDVAVAALRESLPEARITGVAAGMHLLVTLPPGVDDVALADRATRAGLGAHALSGLRTGADGRPGLVVGYAATGEDRLRRAIAALARDS